MLYIYDYQAARRKKALTPQVKRFFRKEKTMVTKQFLFAQEVRREIARLLNGGGKLMDRVYQAADPVQKLEALLDNETCCNVAILKIMEQRDQEEFVSWIKQMAKAVANGPLPDELKYLCNCPEDEEMIGQRVTDIRDAFVRFKM